MLSTDGPVVVEQTFYSSLESVWNAITKPDEMKLWYFDNIESFTHLWEITEVIPLDKITYNWKYKEYPGDSFVTFDLNMVNGQIKLTLSMHIVETFPDDIPEFTRESCIGGWNYFIKQRLKHYLEPNTKQYDN